MTRAKLDKFTTVEADNAVKGVFTGTTEKLLSHDAKVIENIMTERIEDAVNRNDPSATLILELGSSELKNITRSMNRAAQSLASSGYKVVRFELSHNIQGISVDLMRQNNNGIWIQPSYMEVINPQ